MNATRRTVTAAAVLAAAILAGVSPAQAGGTISDVTLSTLSGPPGTGITIESTCVFEGSPVTKVRAFLQDSGEGGAAEAPSGSSGLSRYQLVVPADTEPGDKLLRVHCAQTEEFTFTVTDEPPVTPPAPTLTFNVSPTSGSPGSEVVVSIDCHDVDGASATRAEVEFRTFEAPPLVVETGLDAAGTASPTIVIPDVRRPFSHEIAVKCYIGDVGVATAHTSFEVTEPAPTTTSPTQPATTAPRFTG